MKYHKEDWQYEVRNGDTKLGYDDWVEHRKEAVKPDTQRSILQEFVKDLQSAYGFRGNRLDSKAMDWPDLETTYWKALKLLKGTKHVRRRPGRNK